MGKGLEVALAFALLLAGVEIGKRIGAGLLTPAPAAPAQ